MIEIIPGFEDLFSNRPQLFSYIWSQHVPELVSSPIFLNSDCILRSLMMGNDSV